MQLRVAMKRTRDFFPYAVERLIHQRQNILLSRVNDEVPRSFRISRLVSGPASPKSLRLQTKNIIPKAR